MRVLLAVLFISTLHVILKCDNENSKISLNSKPDGKPLQKGIKIYNARKYGKVKKAYEKKILRENPDNLKSYTVFPPYYISPTEIQGERKPRVKKVLPDYGQQLLLSRMRRAVNNTTNVKKANVHGVSKVKKGQPSVLKTKNVAARNSSNVKPLAKNTKGIKRQLKRKSKSNKIGRVKRNKKSKLRKAKKSGKATVRKSKGNLKDAKNTKVRSSVKKQNKKDEKQKSSLRNNEKKKVVKRKAGSRRLIAARDATIEEYPYVVSIQKNHEHWCAGALLNQRLVITTANCIWKSNRISRMRVRAGSRHYDRGGQVARIQEVAKHPKWSLRGGPDNDIGLILLDRFLKFSASVHGVDLPNKAMMPPFDDVWVTSWGAERRDGIFDDTSRTLQVYRAELVDHNRCNNVTERYGVSVSHNFICLAQRGRRSPCTRDTGAPAVSDGILWGLASWGIRKLCGTERFPAMFTYVASPSSIDFITNATHYLMSDQRHDPYPDRLMGFR